MEEPAVDVRKVFVVHGRNSAAREAMFTFLRALGLEPIEWSMAVNSTGRGSPYIGDILDSAFSMAQAIVVLSTPDDIGYLKERYRGSREPDYETKPTPQARLNVVFEAGLAIGRNPERTILVELGDIRPFSDVAGRHVIRMKDSAERRLELAHRLRTAGCVVNLEGTDWLRAGQFEDAIKPASSQADQESLKALEDALERATTLLGRTIYRQLTADELTEINRQRTSIQVVRDQLSRHTGLVDAISDFLAQLESSLGSGLDEADQRRVEHTILRQTRTLVTLELTKIYLQYY